MAPVVDKFFQKHALKDFLDLWRFSRNNPGSIIIHEIMYFVSLVTNSAHFLKKQLKGFISSCIGSAQYSQETGLRNINDFASTYGLMVKALENAFPKNGPVGVKASPNRRSLSYFGSTCLFSHQVRIGDSD